MISRRTVVAGAAWAMPAVVVAEAAPAAAASGCTTAYFGPGSCLKVSGSGNPAGYRLAICFTRTCAGPVRVSVTEVRALGYAPVKVGQTIDLSTSGGCLTMNVDFPTRGLVNEFTVAFNDGSDRFSRVPAPNDLC